MTDQLMAETRRAEMPSRPVLRWHGGKWLLAPWIIEHFPPHRVYVEPFGGAASVLLRKPRSYGEVYNDLDEDVVNLFRVLRSDRAGELVEALRLTPFARREFNDAYAPTDNELELARQLIVRSFMGFDSAGHNRDNGRTGFRARGEPVVIEGDGGYLIDGEQFTARQLLAKANGVRVRLGAEPFVLPDADAFSGAGASTAAAATAEAG
mgnify:CR=1 FL=1